MNILTFPNICAKKGISKIQSSFMKQCLLSIIFILASCTSKNNIDQFNDMEGFVNKKKSIIIIQNNHIDKRSEGKYDIISTWTQIGTGKKLFIDPNNTVAQVLTLGITGNLTNFNTMVYYIEPGVYNLESINMDDYYKIAVHNLVSFDVKAGEIVYLGSLEINNKNTSQLTRAIKISDHYQEAVSYFHTRYGYDYISPVKRLMKLKPEVGAMKKLYDEYGEAYN